MIRCLVVDDERLAIELMEDNIRQIPFLQHVASCRNALEATELLEHQQIDLIFIDIQMPGLSGLQFVAGMTKGPMIILVTAYEKYALQGFNLDVLDYLIKPVPFERFFKAANKAYRLYMLNNRSGEILPPVQDYIFVNADYSLVRINISDIRYIEGLKDYIKIFIDGEDKPIVSRLSLRYMEEKLPPEKFMRVHRSYIIALCRIKVYKKNKVILNGEEIPVSETGREALMNYMGFPLN